MDEAALFGLIDTEMGIVNCFSSGICHFDSPRLKREGKGA
jgi:hypothetical protein